MISLAACRRNCRISQAVHSRVKFNQTNPFSQFHLLYSSENFWQCLLADPSLDDTLLDLPESIQNSKFFCFLFVEKRISHIFEDHLGREYRKIKLKIIEPNSLWVWSYWWIIDYNLFIRDMGGFSSVFRAIWWALNNNCCIIDFLCSVAFILEYIDNFQSNDSNKSFRDILYVAVFCLLLIYNCRSDFRRAASHWEFDKDQKGWDLNYGRLCWLWLAVFISDFDWMFLSLIFYSGFSIISCFFLAPITCVRTLFGEIPSIWFLEILFMSNSIQEGRVHIYLCVQAGFHNCTDPNSEERPNDLACQTSHFLSNQYPLQWNIYHSGWGKWTT